MIVKLEDGYYYHVSAPKNYKIFLPSEFEQEYKNKEIPYCPICWYLGTDKCNTCERKPKKPKRKKSKKKETT